MAENLYKITYTLHGVRKEFVIRTNRPLIAADAWHWAACDAGAARIPRSDRDKSERMSKPKAERFGIADVAWVPCKMTTLEQS